MLEKALTSFARQGSYTNILVKGHSLKTVEQQFLDLAKKKDTLVGGASPVYSRQYTEEGVIVANSYVMFSVYKPDPNRVRHLGLPRDTLFLYDNSCWT